MRLPTLSVLALTNLAIASAQVPNVRYNCGPCLDRSGYTVRAIVHGSESDPFWQQVRDSAMQSAEDMGVEFAMDLTTGPFNPEEMATTIAAVAYGESKPDALLVTIPTVSVRQAVEEVVNAGVPVFGLNSGASYGRSVGVLDFVAPDDTQGGNMAARQLQTLITDDITSVLYVNDEEGNEAMESRYRGLQEALGNAAVITLRAVDGSDSGAMASELQTALEGCNYQAVVLSGTRTLPHAIAAYESAGCSFSDQPIGAFDTSSGVFDAIREGRLAFTIDQQQALQGALSAQMAALYASTGKTLALPVNGAYLTGPHLITNETIPSQTDRERQTIRIAGIHHGTTTDAFWDPVYAASMQAAFDMGVELVNPRPENLEESVLQSLMASNITALCEDGIDGIFVSIPSSTVESAIQRCLDLGVPVMSINAGADTSSEMGLLHHIGMLEYNAGHGAGSFLAEQNIREAICINHAEGVNVVEERCNGFRDAVEAAGVDYVGQVYVPDSNQDQYISLVEDFVSQNLPDASSDWEGFGILAAGGPQHVPVIALQARHTGAVIGAFDTSSDLYDAVDAGIKEFGIDQQPYLQGYMPVVLLTHYITSGQRISNQVIESGPSFVQGSPSDAQVTCEEQFFETCGMGTDEDSSANNGGRVIIGSIAVVLHALLGVAWMI